ncbi:hypothetical protein AVEN_225806-1 [Araneus ventricosus]|uniref:Uncharacterized protein n=1 Tax=Araneus ventricosus TaxID=182803 RepID=A0A4Y2BA97_ARAVE|nr:hypothetical protein AVEN_225806-1 [Araneus ventricosus]
MTADIQTDRLPVDGFCPKFERNLQIMFKDHIRNFIPVALIVFELSCSQTDRHTDIIPKLCFLDSGRSKTWRFVKISSSNFLTITSKYPNDSSSLTAISQTPKGICKYTDQSEGDNFHWFLTEKLAMVKPTLGELPHACCQHPVKLKATATGERASSEHVVDIIHFI